MFSRLRNRLRACLTFGKLSASGGWRLGSTSFRPQVDCLEPRCLMTSGVLSTFFLTPGSAGSTVIGYAAPGAGSNMWLLDFQSGIARLSEQGTLTRFEPNSDAYTSPPTIAVGSDGNAWFTDFVQHQIGRLTPTGTLTTFPVAGG